MSISGGIDQPTGREPANAKRKRDVRQRSKMLIEGSVRGGGQVVRDMVEREPPGERREGGWWGFLRNYNHNSTEGCFF